MIDNPALLLTLAFACVWCWHDPRRNEDGKVRLPWHFAQLRLFPSFQRFPSLLLAINFYFFGWCIPGTWVLGRDTCARTKIIILMVQVRQSWVRYYCLDSRTEFRKIPPFPESVASVLLLIVELWVWPETSALTIILRDIVRSSSTRGIEVLICARYVV